MNHHHLSLEVLIEVYLDARHGLRVIGLRVLVLLRLLCFNDLFELENVIHFAHIQELRENFLVLFGRILVVRAIELHYIWLQDFGLIRQEVRIQVGEPVETQLL